MKVKQKVVLITGASSGMGRASALYLSAQGFTVYAGTRTPEKVEDIQSPNLAPFYLSEVYRSYARSLL